MNPDDITFESGKADWSKPSIVIVYDANGTVLDEDEDGNVIDTDEDNGALIWVGRI